MRILLIEKDSKGAASTKKGLEDLNFWVDTAYEEERVLSLAQDFSYDLILIAIPLPKMEELKFFKTLLGKESSTPILCFTNNPPEQAGTGQEVSATYKIFDLLSGLKTIFKEEEGTRGAKIYFGPLILDPVTHKVWREEKEISLTPKEYTLLDFFIRHPNQILTRTMIANHVWNQNFDFFTNVIDVYINYLRRKVDQGYTTKLIHTVRGKGYILKEE